jgi:hypothetical protein
MTIMTTIFSGIRWNSAILMADTEKEDDHLENHLQVDLIQLIQLEYMLRFRGKPEHWSLWTSAEEESGQNEEGHSTFSSMLLIMVLIPSH